MEISRFLLVLSLCAMLGVPSLSRAEGVILVGFPAATSRCTLEQALSVSVKDYMPNNEGQMVSAVAGNTFIVAQFGVVFRNATSTISSKDFYLDSGKARFECVGFAMQHAAGQSPIFVGGTAEATLSIGGEENYAKTGGRTGLSLVFSGPRDYAKGTLAVVSAFPVKAKSKVTAGAKSTPTPTGKKSKKDKKGK